MNKEKYTTKAIVEVGLISVVMFMIVLMSTYLPILQVLGGCFLPIPIAILYLRYNLNVAGAGAVISFILTAFLVNPITAIFFGINYAIVGITLGYCIKQNKKPYNLFVTIFSVTILVITLTIVFYVLFVERVTIPQFLNDTISSINSYAISIIDETKNAYIKMGAPDQIINTIELSKKMVSREYIIAFIPPTLLIQGFILTYITIVLNNSILKKLKIKYVKAMSFADFYVSNLVGAALIGIMSISIILKSRGIDSAIYPMTISMVLVEFVLTINGIAAISYFFIRKKKLSPIAVTIIIVITYPMGLGKLYALIGLIEMLFDFRKLDPHRIFKGKGA
ncbi:DUF2232 domain-containing protein [Clostridium senegalense]|uniref:DUF2232 domain-containing protein n=1 Tax=Clostridium senegalense TaxID=1465809 RepID=A0A6M0H3B5_9CLOT|nr:DUF2232 domain-containing protein [Clostridium senegalense]NEU04371.1 DUF2232 domain-containing protein [Clostridium senegalense]